MTLPPLRPRRAAVALLAGVLAATTLLLVFPPGRYDVAPLRLSGTTPLDEGYWSSPLLAREGLGGMEPFDTRLALCHALPQNALGAAARALGVPLDTARGAGSVAAAGVLGALCVAFGGLAGLALLAFLLSAPGFGHLASDLGEAPAAALAAAWLWLVARGKPGAAAVLAGFALFQKGAGLFLGLGSLAGAWFDGPGRAGRLARVACGSALGVIGAVAIAGLVFRDAPLEFLLRPWTTTAAVRPVGEAASGVALLSHAVQLAFAGGHGATFRLWPLLVAAAVLAPRARPSPAALAAAFGGALYYFLFPDPQRFLPWLPVLVLPAIARAPPPSVALATPARASRGGLLLALLLAPVAASAGARALGIEPRAIAYSLATLALLAGVAWAQRAAAPWRRRAAAAALVACAVLGPVAAAREPLFRTDALHRLADAVAARTPAGADVIGYGVLTTRLRGTVWYFDFRQHWIDDLAARRPARLWRVRAVEPDAHPPPLPRLVGYVPDGTVEPLGSFPFDWRSLPRDCFLDGYVPEPAPPR